MTTLSLCPPFSLLHCCWLSTTPFLSLSPFSETHVNTQLKRHVHTRPTVSCLPFPDTHSRTHTQSPQPTTVRDHMHKNPLSLTQAATTTTNDRREREKEFSLSPPSQANQASPTLPPSPRDPCTCLCFCQQGFCSRTIIVFCVLACSLPSCLLLSPAPRPLLAEYVARFEREGGE